MRISDWSSDVCSSDLKLAVEAGFSAGVSYTGVLTSKYDQIGARVVALKDISGRHGSWVVSPTVEYGTPISKRAFIGLSASFNIYGKGFGRYSYDIDPAGAATIGNASCGERGGQYG